MKKCFKCNMGKQDSEFSKCKRHRDGLQSWCKSCVTIIDKVRYKDPEIQKKLRERNRKRRDQNRILLYKYLQDKECQDCKESNTILLDFDHTRDKFETVSVMANRIMKEQGPEFPFMYVSDDEICNMLNRDNYEPSMWSNKHWPVYVAVRTSIAAIALENGFAIIIDTTNMSKSRRAKWVTMAKEFDVPIVAHVHLDDILGLERRKADPRGQAPEMWEKVHKRFQEQYEEVTLDEGIDDIEIVENK